MQNATEEEDLSRVASLSNGLRSGARTVATSIPVVVDAYRFLRKPMWETAVWRDFFQFIRGASFLRAIPQPPDDAPVALLVTWRDDVHDVKMLLVMAAALKRRGYRVVVVRPSPLMTRTRRYFSKLGLGRVVSRTQYEPSRSDIAEVDGKVRELLEGDLTFSEVKAWMFRGYLAGPVVLSTIIRETEDAAVDLSTPRSKARLGELGRELCHGYLVADRVLTNHKPSIVLLHEPGYVKNAPFVDVSIQHGIDVIHLAGAGDNVVYPRRITADTRLGIPLCISKSTYDVLLDEHWGEEEDSTLQQLFQERYDGSLALQRTYQPETGRHDREAIVKELSLDPDTPLAVVFCHVLWDASFWAGEDLYESYSSWLVETVKAASQNTNLNWLIKTHPSNAFRYKHGDTRIWCAELKLLNEHFSELPGHIRVLPPDTTITAPSLYLHGSYGVTVRGSPGFEMACFGKPVLTAGSGGYVGYGFTLDSSTQDEYLQRISELHTYPPLSEEARQRAKTYALALFTRRPWRMRSFVHAYEFAQKGWHPIDRNILPVAKSLDDIEANGDLDDVVAWMTEAKNEEYIQGWRSLLRV